MASTNPDAVSRADEPHPEIAGLLQQMGAAPMPPLPSLGVEGARAFVDGMFPEAENPTEVADTMELVIDAGEADITVRVYIPEAEPPFDPLVYVHGGGWATGSLDTFEETCRQLTATTDRLTVSVDYRLSPEAKFPAPLEDVYGATKWVQDNAEALKVDPSNLAIAGDSAGGNLAAAVSHLARDRGDLDISRQVLLYPVTDTNFDTESYQENAEGYLLSKADMEHFWDAYLRDDTDARNPYAAPLQDSDFSDLPATTVMTCGFDPLRDEGAAYAQAVEEGGNDVNHIHYDDAIHGIAQMVIPPMAIERGADIIADAAADL